MQGFKYILLILVITLSCKNDKKTTNTKDSKIDLEIDTVNTLSFVAKVDTIFDPNAPKRITRNINLDSEGNLLIAAYDDIVRYNGDSFTKLMKPKAIESWYAFDVLEDSNENIWIASDQSGVFRIDSETGAITNFTTKDGLGHLRNMCVYEDKARNIWIGGQGGLSRYDGNKFTNFTLADGLPHNDVNTIVEDNKGNIWFGTRGNAGLYDGNTFTEIKNNEGKSFFNVWSIIEDRSNNIWLVDSSGLWKHRSKTFTHELSDVWKIYEDTKGGFWYTGMLNGGSSILKRKEASSLVDEKLEITEVFKAERMFFGVVEDKEGNLWIGGGDGIWQYNGETIKYYTGSIKNKENIANNDRR